MFTECSLQVGYTALVVVIIVINGILLVAFLALWWILGVKVYKTKQNETIMKQ
jgi:hypothetical protein